MLATLSLWAVVSQCAASPAHQANANQVCGRVEVVSCEGPSSSAGMLLSVPSGNLLERNRLVRVVIPAGDRARSQERLEERFEGQSVCIAHVAAASSSHSSIVANLEQMTIHEPRNQVAVFSTGVFRTCDRGVQPPTVISEVHPHRPPNARVDGTVVLQAVVDAEGRVLDVRVTRSLDPDTDAAAQRAFSGWRFRAGMVGGRPVPVVVSAEMTFKSF